ncbi:MAG: putative peptidoglycan O-acetyltransferase YrhL [Actinomycetota bacterium]
MKLQYMPHVDGLRAYAVLGVMCFHFGIASLPGGFFGVDVFFVISGFLITSILWREMTQENFSYLTFYRRRALRILPALFVVTIITAIVAFNVVSPKDFSMIANGLFGIATFSSNWVFQFDASSDYFAPSSDLNPLLHMWSLAIEEQFYIFFPAILMLIIRKAKSKTRLIVAALAALSLALVFVLPDTNLFYITPARMWQLLAGSLLAIGFATLNRIHKSATALATLGIALIAISYFAPFFEVSGLSGFSIVPVIGAVLVLGWGDAPNRIIQIILTARPIVFVGKISYSLYLVHWPIVVFSRHLGLDPFTVQMQIISFGATFIAGYLSWRFVEKPFRGISKDYSSTKILKFSVLSLVIILIAGLLLNNHGTTKVKDAQSSTNSREKLLAMGDKFLYYPLYQRGSCFLDFEQTAADYPITECLPWQNSTDSTRLLIFGDSHAAHLYSGLKSNLNNKYSVGQLSAASCRPIKSKDSRCNSTLKLLGSTIEGPQKPDIVAIAGNWNSSLKKMSQSELIRELSKTIQSVRKQQPNIVLVGQMPSFSVAVPDLLYRDNPSGRANYLNISAPTLNPALRDLAQRLNIEFFDPSAAHCVGELCDVGTVSKPWYWDAGHLTQTGSAVITKELSTLIKEMMS